MEYFIGYALWVVLVSGWALSVMLAWWIWIRHRDLKAMTNDRDHYKRLLTILDDEPVQTLEEIVLEAHYDKARKQLVGYQYPEE